MFRQSPLLFHRLDFLLLVCFGFFLSSCSSLITSAMRPAVGNIQQQSDINLVCEGTPAYLLMIDSMLVSSPNNKSLLLTASQSYSAYAAALEECGEVNDTRILPVAAKSKLYGIQLLSRYLPLNNGQDYEVLDRKLAGLCHGDVPDVFWGAFGWLTWVKYQKGSPEAIADLVIIEKIMARLLEIDESYQGGSIHLFFGSYYAAKPAMFGGKPDLSKYHFEKALDVSEREFLMAQVTYAETLARATFDQELHDRMLNEVLNFPLDSAPEFRLSNEIAVNKAKRLLNDNYFGE
ncbi:MAG: TRAP transporter TatT component family protein [Desulforhopalus sp.]